MKYSPLSGGFGLGLFYAKKTMKTAAIPLKLKHQKL